MDLSQLIKDSTAMICVAPVLMLTVAGLLVLMFGVIADRFPKGKLNHWMPPEYLSIAVMVPMVIFGFAALRSAILRPETLRLFPVGGQPGSPLPAYLIQFDPLAMFLSLAAIIGTLVVVVMSLEYFGDHNQRNRGEYFALLIFATVAAILLACSTDLLMIYLSIEFLSLASYVLAAYWKDDPKSSEAGMKYFLFGALSSALMLYGMSMLYGLTNTTNLAQIASTLASGQALSTPAALTAVILVLAGIGYKLALVPFHMWAPDTYEGAPTPITAWLSVASKAAGLAVAARFLLTAVPMRSDVDWYTIILVLSAVSMTLGNMVAITQKNIKRMLAYSSIAQVGYMLIGLLAAAASHNNPANFGLAGLLIYAASYLFMNLGAFAVVIAVERKTGSSDLAAYVGLMKRSPFLAASMVVFFLSLAGMPPTAGFLGKLYVFAGAIQTGQKDLLILAIIAVANSVISVYYYFNVVRLMFMNEGEAKSPIGLSKPLRATIILMLILTFAICLAAGPVVSLAKASVIL